MDGPTVWMPPESRANPSRPRRGGEVRLRVANPTVRHAESYPFERPLLHACSNTSFLGDVRLNIGPGAVRRGGRHPIPAVQGRDIRIGLRGLPLDGGIKTTNRLGDTRAVRVARFVYTLSPWTYGVQGFTRRGSSCRPTGVKLPLLFIRYERPEAVRRLAEKGEGSTPLSRAAAPNAAAYSTTARTTPATTAQITTASFRLDTWACAYSSALADGTYLTEELRGGPTMAPLSRVTSAAPSNDGSRGRTK